MKITVTTDDYSPPDYKRFTRVWHFDTQDTLAMVFNRLANELPLNDRCKSLTVELHFDELKKEGEKNEKE